ncbi:MAG: CsiV family protein [Gammaproteobacteria bacterium]
MKIRNLAISLLLLSLLPGIILAKVTGDEEIRFYDVEIVIFKNNKVPKGSEFILPVSSPRIDEEILDLSSPRSIEAARERSYEIIPADELRLTESVIKIVDSPRYSLLAHTGWRQPGLEKDLALPVWIRGGRIFGTEYTSIDDYTSLLEISNSDTAQQSAEPGSSLSVLAKPGAEIQAGLYELEGKITIALSRYLHTYADLVLRRPRLAIGPEFDVNNENKFWVEDLPDTRILNNHPLKEHRRMRSNRLHYLDNPEFSMLILITPYERPEISEETADLTIDATLDNNSESTSQ